MESLQKKVKFSVLIIAILYLFVFRCDNIVLAAEPEHLGRVIDGSLLTMEKEVEDTQISMLRGLLLNKGTAKCINAGEGQVTASGATVAHVVCQELYIDLSLDQYNPSTESWHTFELWSVSKEDTSLFVKSFTIPVEKGYYYRVRGIHAAKDGDTYESIDTCTNGIWID
ncbi:DUF6147 family protein [Lactonifactor longoviformis]|uniref:DUF6147 family protein n=1 Tax=Lactonifactor longoviformis TaxID=341220 RepID=UPI002108A071|nr:DUF6147 family protein [Lactonifactor longoviformis]MCQ4670206.1 DUF6147 family protein [Lactonifactor longoviformis]